MIANRFILLIICLLSILGFLVSCEESNRQTQEMHNEQNSDANFDWKGNIIRRYYVSFKDLEDKLPSVNPNDPFEEIPVKYPSDLFVRAGYNIEGMILLYSWEKDFLEVTASNEAHDKIEKIIGVKGEAP